MASSAVVAVKKGLRDLLQASGDLDGVQVEYGIPDLDTLKRERIFLGRADFPQSPGPMRAGRVHRNETGELEVYVDALVVGGDQEAADERVLALGQVVEEIVADHRNIGNDTAHGITVNETTIRRGELTPGVVENGSIARIKYTLHWTARLA